MYQKNYTAFNFDITNSDQLFLLTYIHIVIHVLRNYSLVYFVSELHGYFHFMAFTGFAAANLNV